MEFNEKSIKKKVTAVAFDRGQSSYMSGEVQEFKVEALENNTQKVTATVVTAWGKEKNNVELILYTNNGEINFECDCNKFKELKKKKGCKHIVATFFRYIKGEREIVYNQLSIEDAVDNNVKLSTEDAVDNKIKLSTEDAVIDSNVKIDNIEKSETIQCKNKESNDKNTSVEACKTEKSENKLIRNVDDYKVITKDEKVSKTDRINEIINKHVGEVKSKSEISDLFPEVLKGRNRSMIKSSTTTRIEPKSLKIVNLDFEYEFSYYEGSSLKLKVGEVDLYDVNNISGFLSSFKHKNYSVYCGMGFTFNPKIHTFNEKSISILELLIEAYESPENSFRIESSNYNDTKVYLTDEQTKKFFRMIGNREFNATIYEKMHYNIRIFQEDLPLAFEVDIEGKDIILNQEGSMPLALSEDKEYLFYNNNIYRPSKRQIEEYTYFYDKFNETNKSSLVFGNDDLSLNEILDRLNNITNSVKLVTEKEKEIFKNSLRAKLYFYKNNEDVIMKVIFNYKDIDIDPFSPKKFELAKKVTNRDIKKEVKIFETIKELGFEMTRTEFILKGEDSVLFLLEVGMKRLEELAEIHYDDSFNGIKIYTPEDYRTTLSLDNNLLQFNFDISGVRKSEIKNIFAALKENQRYYKLKNGGYVSLREKELKNMSNLIKYLDVDEADLEKDSMSISRYKALYIEQVLKENNLVYVDRNKDFKELVNNIQNVAKIDYNIPEKLQTTMRSYQKVGYKWFRTLGSYGFGGILADEMGLGKTLQAISVMVSYIEEVKENKKPIIVVAPTSLVYNWQVEIEKFAPQIKSLVVYGTQGEREKLRENMQEVDVIITSYGVLKKDIYDYKDVEFSYCFIDEAQQIKNPKSANAKAVKTLKADGCFALTGTPIENSLMELWSIFDFIMPGYLLNYNQFLKKYEVPIVENKSKEALEALNKHIQPFILRRLKTQVMKELPEKIEKQLVVEMSDEQKAAYISYLGLVKNKINTEIVNQGFNSSKIHILGALTHLRQICCDPSIILDDFNGDSAKMLALDELIEESLGAGHRILLFSQFTTVLNKIAVRLKKKKINYFYLDGSTKSKDRLDLADRFNEGEVDIFLISLKAGGTGLNLTGADVVIHFDPWWNPAVEEQATDRAHRIGQNKTVEVIKLLTKGTIEEKIYKLQEAKREVIKNVINDGDNESSLISSMSQEEIEELFKI